MKVTIKGPMTRDPQVTSLKRGDKSKVDTTDGTGYAVVLENTSDRVVLDVFDTPEEANVRAQEIAEEN